jgi:deoxyribonuclease (pyrimidine dimer)
MTRINAGVEPSELKRMHLVAEWREITMVPASLKRSLKTKTPHEVLEKISPQFTLNKGHVSFFYDKMNYLKRRMKRIAEEMNRRGYLVDYSRFSAFDGIDKMFFNEWNETEKARNIVLERINFRISQKPHLYTD